MVVEILLISLSMQKIEAMLCSPYKFDVAFVEKPYHQIHRPPNQKIHGAIQDEPPGGHLARRPRRGHATGGGVLVPRHTPLPAVPSSDPTVPLRGADAGRSAGAQGVPDAAAQDDAVRGLPHQQQRHGALELVLRGFRRRRHGRGGHLLLPRRKRRHPAASAGADELHQNVVTQC